MNTLPRRRARLKAVSTVLLLLCAGCSGLLPKPAAPPTRYTLDAGAATTPQPVRADGLTLVVALPSASPGFDSARMVYVERPQALEAFAFHAWVDTPAHMLAPLLVRALQAGGAFRAVLQPPSAARGDWRLETEVLRLQQDFATRPSRLRLSLRAVLVDAATRQPLAWREFDVSVPAASDDPAGGAAAAALATQQLLAAVAEFAAREAAQRPLARREP